jgi:hypothetical protein
MLHLRRLMSKRFLPNGSDTKTHILLKSNITVCLQRFQASVIYGGGHRELTATLHDFPEDIYSLELTDEIKSAEIVNYFISSFKSKSVILELKQNGWPKLIELPVILEDWELTNKSFDSILTDIGIREEDRTKLRRLFNYNANRITDHFTARTLSHLHAGRKARIERTEKAKNTPPTEISISEASRMHEGNITVKGMINGGSGKVEKMYTVIGLRCGVDLGFTD